MPEENVAVDPVEETEHTETPGEVAGEEQEVQLSPDQLLDQIHREIEGGDAGEVRTAVPFDAGRVEGRLDELSRRLDQAISPQAKDERPDYDDPAVLQAILDLPEEQRLSALNNLQRKRTEAEVGRVREDLEAKIGNFQTGIAATLAMQYAERSVDDVVRQILTVPGMDEATKAVARNWEAQRWDSRLGKMLNKNRKILADKGLIADKIMSMGSGLRLYGEQLGGQSGNGQETPTARVGADTMGTGGKPRTMDIETDERQRPLTAEEKLLDRIAEDEDAYGEYGAAIFNPLGT